MVYFVRLSKSGNSLVITLPTAVREALYLGHGDQLAVTVENGRLVMVKMDDRRAAELVAALRSVKP